MKIINIKNIHLLPLISLTLFMLACTVIGDTPSGYGPRDNGSDNTSDNSSLVQDNAVKANFDVKIDGLKVTTTNRSRVLDIGASKFSWSFGEFADNVTDDKYSSINPNHSYSQPGRYIIKLKVESGAFTDNATNVVEVSGSSSNPEDINANFTANITGRQVFFKNTSSETNPDSTTYHWSFGDSTTSQEVNPIHKYNVPGDYAVKLTASDKSSSKSIQKTLSIRVSVEPRIIAYGDSNIIVDNKGRLYTYGANTDELGFTGSQTADIRSGGSSLGRGTTPATLTVDFYIKPVSPFDSTQIFSNVFAGKNHASAITDDDKLYVWGINNKGQLGLNNRNKQQKPIFYGDINVDRDDALCGKYGIKDMVFSSKNGFALCNNGVVYGTGLNDNGQLQNPFTANEQLLFTKVNLDFTVKQLFATSETVYAISDSNDVYSWGSNFKGAGGIGSNETIVVTARKITFPTDVEIIKIVASDNYFAIALTKDGKLYGWGYMPGNKNFIGIDGISSLSTDSVTLPMRLKSKSADGVSITYRDVVVINRSIAAVADNGNVYTWGFYDNNSSLGLGMSPPVVEYIDTPTMVTLPDIEFNSIKKSYYISGGTSHFVYLGKDGYVYGWGDNSRYQLGYKASGYSSVANLPTPSKVPSGDFLWKK